MKIKLVQLFIGKRKQLMYEACIGFVLLFIMVYSARSQPANFTKTPAVGVNLVLFDFKGADSLRSFGRSAKTGIALHYQNSFSARFDYSVTLAGSFLDFPDNKNGNTGDENKQLLLETDLSVRVKVFKAPKLFNPYVQGGVGLSVYDNKYGAFVPAGIGCQVNLLPDVFLLLNSQYRLPVTNTQERHFYHSIGFAGAINRKKIVKLKTVPLPTVSVKITIVKPIDTDGDGIADSVDACPQVIGVIRYKGCPIPDRDGDKINDEEDQCVDVKGVVAYKGCPVPDRKQDGIAEELRIRISKAAAHIFFETGNYRLLPWSFPTIDTVAQILKDYPQAQLIIEGHTDNNGTLSGNQTLSENRARTVLLYLIKAGIDAGRLQSTGYGQQKPVATNKTREGRSQNRRVELRLIW